MILQRCTAVCFAVLLASGCISTKKAGEKPTPVDKEDVEELEREDDGEAGKSKGKQKNLKLSDLSSPKTPGTGWKAKGNIRLADKGANIDLGGEQKKPKFDMSFDNNDVYVVTFFKGETKQGQVRVKRAADGVRRGLARNVEQVPANAVSGGYDRVHIKPTGGDHLYAVGHFILID